MSENPEFDPFNTPDAADDAVVSDAVPEADDVLAGIDLDSELDDLFDGADMELEEDETEGAVKVREAG